MLQIENEFYGTIRPKRRIRPGERPLHALRQRGVEYVEVRLMDLDPFLAVGIDADTMRFLDVFLMHCLLRDSPPDTPRELAAIVGNKQRTASRGREPGLLLTRGDEQVSLFEWGAQVLAQCEPVAAALDAAYDTVHGAGGDAGAHSRAHAMAVSRLRDPDTTPSARVLQAMQRDHAKSYVAFVLAQSLRHRDAIWKLPYPHEMANRFVRLAEGSLVKQRQIETADTIPFEIYRQDYLSAHRLNA
jgi:glutamate--cysteine ligase